LAPDHLEDRLSKSEGKCGQQSERLRSQKLHGEDSSQKDPGTPRLLSHRVVSGQQRPGNPSGRGDVVVKIAERQQGAARRERSGGKERGQAALPPAPAQQVGPEGCPTKMENVLEAICQPNRQQNDQQRRGIEKRKFGFASTGSPKLKYGFQYGK
jgi:hypothetical protein